MAQPRVRQRLGCFGLPFDSGHVLALRVFPENDFSPYRTVWHRDPGGRWSINVDGPRLDTACPRYYGAACHFTGHAQIRLTWDGPATLRVTMDSPAFLGRPAHLPGNPTIGGVTLPARGVLATGLAAWEILDPVEYERTRSQTSATAQPFTGGG